MSKNFDLSLTIKAIDKATGPLRGIGSKISAFAKTTSSVGKALSLGVTAPIIGIGTAGVAAFSQFESGLANISTLIDTNKESLEGIGDQVLKIGKRTPVALSDLTAALYDIRSAGVSAVDQFKVLEGSAHLAVAGLGTTAEAVDIVTSAINAFGLKGKEQQRVYDLLFRTTETGKTTISQLAKGFGSVAGTVASAGIQLDEYLASVAALTTTGLPASEAHTQLRAVIAGLLRTTKDTSLVFHHLGAKDFKDLIAKSGGLVPALDRIRTLLHGNDSATLQLLGSVEGLNAVLGLTGGQAGAFKDTLVGMREGADHLGGAFDKQSKTVSSRMKVLKNEFMGVSISIGKQLLPSLEKLMPKLEGAIKWWDGLGDGTKKAIVILAGFSAVVGPTVTALSSLATVLSLAQVEVVALSFSGLIADLAAVFPMIASGTGVMEAFNLVLAMNPIGVVVLAVTALAGAAYLIYKNWGPIKKFFGGVWDGLVNGVKKAWDFVEPYLKKIGEFFLKFSGIGQAIKVFQAAKGFFGGGDSAPAPRPMLGVSNSSAPAAGKAPQGRVLIEIPNLPKGSRVSTDKNSTQPLVLDLGYSTVTP